MDTVTKTHTQKVLNPIGIMATGNGQYQVGREIVKLGELVDDFCSCGGAGGPNTCDHIHFARIYRGNHPEEETSWIVGEKAFWKPTTPYAWNQVGKGGGVFTITKLFASLTGIGIRARIECTRGKNIYAYTVGVADLKRLDEMNEG